MAPSVGAWISEYESYAAATLACARRTLRLCVPGLLRARALAVSALDPRRLFGLAFESRPPPRPV